MPGSAKNLLLAIFVKRPIKPLGNLVRTQETDFKNLVFLSELQEPEVRAKFSRLAEFGHFFLGGGLWRGVHFPKLKSDKKSKCT